MEPRNEWMVAKLIREKEENRNRNGIHMEEINKKLLKQPEIKWYMERIEILYNKVHFS